MAIAVHVESGDAFGVVRTQPVNEKRSLWNAARSVAGRSCWALCAAAAPMHANIDITIGTTNFIRLSKLILRNIFLAEFYFIRVS